MNRVDILEEKLAVQKALLHLENVFGRPVTKEDRDLVRPLYQRYRSLKRLVIRNSGVSLIFFFFCSQTLYLICRFRE